MKNELLDAIIKLTITSLIEMLVFFCVLFIVVFIAAKIEALRLSLRERMSSVKSLPVFKKQDDEISDPALNKKNL